MSSLSWGGDLCLEGLAGHHLCGLGMLLEEAVEEHVEGVHAVLSDLVAVEQSEHLAVVVSLEADGHPFVHLLAQEDEHAHDVVVSDVAGEVGRGAVDAVAVGQAVGDDVVLLGTELDLLAADVHDDLRLVGLLHSLLHLGADLHALCRGGRCDEEAGHDGHHCLFHFLIYY